MQTIQFLPHILIILSAAVFVVAIFKRLNLSPVLGYFVAGACIGEHGFAIVTARETSSFGEFGIVFLLFAIGLELTFERLKAMRRHVFGFGTLQVMLSGALIAFLVYILGGSINAAIIIGGGLALSSTAIVLQVLAEHRRQSTQVGRLALATLLLQDFAVVPLLVLIPLLAGAKAGIMAAMGVAFLKAIIALVAIFVVGRLALRPLFSMISSANSAKSNELFVATTLLIALGAAWGTEHMGLSLALGAFVAGLLVAETEFQHQVEDTISPFKGLFLGLFFMTVGMAVDINLVMAKLPLILLISVGVIVVKTTIISLLCLLCRFTVGAAIHAGLLLSQGGEFAFILFRLAADKSILDAELGQILLLVVTVTMALTPLLSALGHWCAARLDKEKLDTDYISQEVADLANHVIITGLGRVGKMVASLLEEEEVHYVAVDSDIKNVEEARINGFPAYPGDASNPVLLRALGIERAQSVIITVEDEPTLKRITNTIHSYFPAVTIIVRAKDLSNADELTKAGAHVIVPETYETGLQLGGAVLKSVGISEWEVSRLKNQFRAGNYVLAKVNRTEGAEAPAADA